MCELTQSYCMANINAKQTLNSYMLIVGQNVLNVLCSGEGTSIFAQLKCFPAVIGQYLCVGFIMLVIKVSF